MMIEECHTHPTFGSILYRIGGKWWMKMSIRQRGFTLWTEGKNGGGLGTRLRQTYSHMGGDIYFVCLSDIGGKLIGKTCITAAVVIELVSPISLSSNSFPISNWVLQNNLWVRLLFVWTKSMKIFLNALFNGVKRIDIFTHAVHRFREVYSKVYSSNILAWLWYETEVRGSGSLGHLQINIINYSGTLLLYTSKDISSSR